MPLVDAEKRQDVMARSMKVGHCIYTEGMKHLG
jgi:hypothetical protein